MADMNNAPPHGGDLAAASARYGHPHGGWLDLSTGINPDAYPIAELPVAAWHDLPYVQPELLATARLAYAMPAASSIVATPGSQPIISSLPKWLPKLPVLLPSLGYADHRLAWQASGGLMQFYPSTQAAAHIAAIDAALAHNSAQHLVVIQPNNPTGLLLPAAQLYQWAQQLSGGGHLIIDETFIDATPAQSVLPEHWHPAMLVLRSVGKFYGLAGLRLGFVIAELNLVERISAELGPWAVSGPAQWVGRQALADIGWQRQMRATLARSQQLHAQWLEPLEAASAEASVQHLPLFSTLSLPRLAAQRWTQWAGERGILVRYGLGEAGLDWVRVGRVSLFDQAGQQRLQQCIAEFRAHL